MSSITSSKGSIWRQWDLHFHTPSSYDYEDKSTTDKALVDGLKAAGVEVVAITDHHKIDPARIKSLREVAGNDLTVLPGIEFRSELGGSEYVHYIGIFPETTDVEDLWTKLAGRLDITPSDVEKAGDDSIWCAFQKGSKVIHDLGGLVSIHAGKKSNSIENLSNKDNIKRIIKKDYVDQGLIDILEIGRVDDEAGYKEIVFPHLERGVPIVICSDNHNINNYGRKSILWVKGDRCFETLRQALYEPNYRVSIAENRPLEPLLRIETISISMPSEAKLRSNGVDHPFCFRGPTKISVSPYLTCLVGGRGTGKSTLLNLIHEKLFPGKNQFFNENRVIADTKGSIEDWISIDDDENRIEIEFLQQNEIEQFAADPSRFTTAVFARLKKLDPEGTLSEIESLIEEKVRELRDHADRLVEAFRLEDLIENMRKEMQTKKRLVESFENPEYKKLASELGALTKENQKLRAGSQRLSEFTQKVRRVVESRSSREGPDESVFDVAIREASQGILDAIRLAEENDGVREATDQIVRIARQVGSLKAQLSDFLETKGLSQENLSDVREASERIAELGENLPDAVERLADIQKRIETFDSNNDLASRYQKTVEDRLKPVNEILSDQSSEVKPIRLVYNFDLRAANNSIFEFLAEQIASNEERKIRYDHIANALSGVAFVPPPSQQELLEAVSSDGKTGQILRDYFTDMRNYELFLQHLRETFLSVQKFQRIKVFYDEKPIESSSFGQRCTAAIVVLVLLGNTPIIIDEPEAHLDSSLIAKYLVNLIKRKKQERQIIFATHNANFVINGDSELVHVLAMDDEHRTVIESTTIENLVHRETLLALEGGAAAFRQRENRYGI
jgi:ABC-type cobalamin/Fe3+-siderophores transport system ATPase subunit